MERDTILNKFPEQIRASYREKSQNPVSRNGYASRGITGDLKSVGKSDVHHHDFRRDRAYANHITGIDVQNRNRINADYDDGSHLFNNDGRIQMIEEHSQSVVIDPGLTTEDQPRHNYVQRSDIVQLPTAATHGANAAFRSSPDTEYHDGPVLFAPMGKLAMRPRHNREVGPSLSSEASMGAPNQGNMRDDLSHGYDNMTSYRSLDHTPTTQTFDDGRVGAAYPFEGNVGLYSQNSPPATSARGYSGDQAYGHGAHPVMEYNNNMGASTNSVQSHTNITFQSDGEDFSGSAAYEYDTTQSGQRHEQAIASGSHDDDMQNEESYSDYNADSPIIEGTGDMLGGGHLSLPNFRTAVPNAANSNKFKQHRGRAPHRVGKPQQKVKKAKAKNNTGAKDPINIQIVDLYDNHNWSFPDVADHLNKEREDRGLHNHFTPNSVHNRYNRSAPVIYKADGRVFVAIKNRRHHTQEELDDLSSGINTTQWNSQMDQVLLQAVANYEAEKWRKVAEAFNSATGQHLQASAISTRYGMLRN